MKKPTDINQKKSNDDKKDLAGDSFRIMIEGLGKEVEMGRNYRGALGSIIQIILGYSVEESEIALDKIGNGDLSAAYELLARLKLRIK